MRPELAAAKIHTGKHEHWPSARPRHWSGNSQLVVSHGQFLACSVLDGNLDQRTSLVVSVSDERATTHVAWAPGHKWSKFTFRLIILLF